MNARLVYTVVRDLGNITTCELNRLKDGAEFEETGEFLYGGSGCDEKIGLTLQRETPSGWVNVEVKDPE